MTLIESNGDAGSPLTCECCHRVKVQYVVWVQVERQNPEADEFDDVDEADCRPTAVARFETKSEAVEFMAALPAKLR